MDDEEDDSINNQIVNSDYYDPEEFHKNFAKLQGIISYFHINCRSLSSNWEAFRELLCEMHGEDFAFDFIGMSEVFGKYKDDRINLPGYHNILTKTREDRRGGGVGIFVKENINFRIREDLSTFIPHVYESIFIETLY